MGKAQAQHGQWFNYVIRDLGFPMVLLSQAQAVLASAEGWFPYGHKSAVRGDRGYRRSRQHLLRETEYEEFLPMFLNQLVGHMPTPLCAVQLSLLLLIQTVSRSSKVF